MGVCRNRGSRHHTRRSEVRKSHGLCTLKPDVLTELVTSEMMSSICFQIILGVGVGEGGVRI